MNENIQELKKKLKKIISAKAYIETLQHQIKQNQKDIDVAKEALRKENQDVEKLQSLTFTAVIAHFSKDKEERLAKEEAEAMRAAVHLKQLEANEETLQRELKTYMDIIQEEDNLKEQLRIIQAKEEIAHQETGDSLQRLMDEMDKNRVINLELQEAIDAGIAVSEKLSEVQNNLDSAQSWGLFDIVGGDFISSMVKHSKINNAQSKIADVQMMVQRFNKELKDVNACELSNISISGSLEIFDVVFDNIFSDFMVQNKITNAKNNVTEFQNKVDDILRTLKKQQQELQSQYKTLNKEYENIINQEA